VATFDLAAFGSDFLTRDQGARVRKAVERQLGALPHGERLLIDLGTARAITPSFVDECLGRLLLNVGEDRFKKSVQLEAREESTRRLVNRVLAHRASELKSKTKPA